MKKIISWTLLLFLLLGGIVGTWSLSEMFRKDALKAWKKEVDQTAQLLTGTIVNWLGESNAPLSGLAVLFENSDNVSEDEFLGAIEALESFSPKQFMDIFIVARPKGITDEWVIQFSSEMTDALSNGKLVTASPGLDLAVRTAAANPDQIIFRPPAVKVLDTTYAPVALSLQDSNGPLVIVGLLNHDALIKGLFDIHDPKGLTVHIQGRFLGPEGPQELQDVEGEPVSNATHKSSTRSVSGRADLIFTWYASERFSDGPQDSLAQVFLMGGVGLSIFVTLFIGLLLRQNALVQFRVKEATNSLIESRRRLDLALTTSGIGIWDWDIVNDTRFWDKAHHQIMGTDPDLPPPRHEAFLALIHPDDVAELEAQIDEVLQGDGDYLHEYRVVRPDGAVRLVSNRALVIRDTKGIPVQMIGTSIDITDQKQSEMNLQRSQQQLKVLFDALPVGVVMISPTGEIREANMISENILGISADEQKMRDLQSQEWKIVRPDGTVMPVEEYPASRALGGEGIVKNVEMGVYQPNGSLLWINTSAAPLSEEAGGGVAVAFEDVTDRKAFETELKKLSQAVEQSPASVVITDPSGAIEYVNPRFCQVTGYTAEEAAGQNPRILKSDATPPELYRDLWETIASGKDWRGEMQNVKKNGDLYWESVSISPIIADDNQITYYLAIKEDITHRKEVDEELAQKSILMKAMIDSPKDIIIFSLDSEYRYTAFNKAHFLEMKRVYNSDIELGQSMLDAITVPEVVSLIKGNLDRVLDGESFQEVQQQPSTNIYYEFNWGVVQDEENQIIGLSAFIRDISGLKQMEKELTDRVKEQDEAQSAMLNMMEDLDEEKALAEDATRAKSDFLANMSHEIRTPMNAVLGLTHLALQTDMTKKQVDYLSKVHNSATSLLGLINDILDFSKIEAGKLDMESIEFNLDEILNSVSTLVAIKAQEKGLELLFQVPRDLPRFLIGDPLRVGQVLINLANNAVKFTEAGEVVVIVSVTEETESVIKLQFVVRDTGIGLSEEQIDKLFKSFSQADTSTTRKYGGTGLGLTISKRLVELMNGDIHVESQPGEGSSFIFTAEFGRQIGVEAPKQVTIPDLTDLEVLVVDDNVTSREIFNSMLTGFRFKVDEASSGAEALEKISGAENPYRLILMDWKMPRMDGIETSHQIRKTLNADQQPKIILATAFDREEARMEAGELNIDAFLGKPVTPSQLYDSVLRAFGRIEGDLDPKLDRFGFDIESLKPIQGARILLIEDNEINQQVAQELLEKVGLIVDIANHGKEGVEMLPKADYEVVLMDIQMPVMDGYEATAEIRKTRSKDDLPILAMTASATVDDRKRALDSGMNDHIAKPIEPKQLFTTLLKWVEPGERDLPEPKPESTAPAVETTGDLPDQVAGIDISNGLVRVGDNKTLYMKLLKKFKQNQGNALLNISAALQSGKIEDAVRMAHTLKGVSGNIGAMDLYETAKDLESGIKELEGSISEDLIIATREKLDIVLVSIDEITASGSAKTVDGGKATLDMERIKPLIKELRRFLEDDDTEASSVLEQLQPLVAGTLISKKLDRVENALGSYDFEKALEQLTSIDELIVRAGDSSEQAAENSPTLDVARLSTLLVELKRFLEDDDTEASTVLEQMQALVSGHELSGVLGEIEGALGNYDFDEALERLAAFEKKLIQA